MNKQLVEMMKKNNAIVKRNVIEIYAAVGLVLHDNGNSDEDIEELFSQVQKKWDWIASIPNHNAVEMLKEATGYDLEEIV